MRRALPLLPSRRRRPPLPPASSSSTSHPLIPPFPCRPPVSLSFVSWEMIPMGWVRHRVIVFLLRKHKTNKATEIYKQLLYRSTPHHLFQNNFQPWFTISTCENQRGNYTMGGKGRGRGEGEEKLLRNSSVHFTGPTGPP